MQSTSWETLGWGEAKVEIKIARRNINNLRYADDTTLMAESEEELKKPLDESERGEWKSWLKAQYSENKDHGIRSHHFMGNRWGNSGNSVKLYFGVLQNHCKQKTAYEMCVGDWSSDVCSSDLQKIKPDTVSTVSPSICHEVMGPDAMIFVFWILSFKPIFSL